MFPEDQVIHDTRPTDCPTIFLYSPLSLASKSHLYSNQSRFPMGLSNATPEKLSVDLFSCILLVIVTALPFLSSPLPHACLYSVLFSLWYVSHLHLHLWHQIGLRNIWFYFILLSSRILFVNRIDRASLLRNQNGTKWPYIYLNRQQDASFFGYLVLENF